MVRAVSNNQTDGETNRTSDTAIGLAGISPARIGLGLLVLRWRDGDFGDLDFLFFGLDRRHCDRLFGGSDFHVGRGHVVLRHRDIAFLGLLDFRQCDVALLGLFHVAGRQHQSTGKGSGKQQG